MSSMDKRTRIARALSEADISGPDDFDEASDLERRMYDRMALAALDNAHIYAIHTVSRPEMFMALAEVKSGTMTITRAGDPYQEWGEETKEGEALHVVIGVDDMETVKAIGKAFDEWGVLGDLTDHVDWAEPADGAGYTFQRGWSDWMRINGITL